MAERDDTPPILEEAGAEVVQKRGVFRVHSKTMLIDSEFDTGDGGTERRREVWTGTQNLSRPGIRRNDEVLLRIVDEDIYNTFMLDWERVYLEAKSKEPVENRSDEPGGDNASDAAEPPTDVDSGEQGGSDEFGMLPGLNDDEDDEADPSPGFGLTLTAGAIAGAAPWKAHRDR